MQFSPFKVHVASKTMWKVVASIQLVCFIVHYTANELSVLDCVHIHNDRKEMDSKRLTSRPLCCAAATTLPQYFSYSFCFKSQDVHLIDVWCLFVASAFIVGIRCTSFKKCTSFFIWCEHVFDGGAKCCAHRSIHPLWREVKLILVHFTRHKTVQTQNTHCVYI